MAAGILIADPSRGRLMEREEIAEKIRFILDPVPQTTSTFYPGPNKRFSNEHVELLLQLESRITAPSSKKFFWDLLGHNFIPLAPKTKREFSASSATIKKAWRLIGAHCECAFMAFIRADRIDSALQGFLEQIKDWGSVNERSNKIIFCVLQVLRNEAHILSDEHLRTIESIRTEYEACIEEIRTWEEKERQRKLSQLQIP